MSCAGSARNYDANISQGFNHGHDRIQQNRLSRHFEVGSRAYVEIFLDSVLWTEQEAKKTATETDQIYGQVYLPRKFKLTITAAGDNSVDALTQDLSFAATYNTEERIDGWFVYAGGGMGMAHGNSATFPRLADLLGWIPHSALIDVAEAIVTTQRDYGDRKERSHARLKYTIEDRGIDWFRDEVPRRAGIVFEERHPLFEKVPYAELGNLVDRLFAHWAEESTNPESFGDFVQRYPKEQLQKLLSPPLPVRATANVMEATLETDPCRVQLRFILVYC